MIFDELRLLPRRPGNRYGTPELLPYSHLVGDGIVMLKDRSLMRSYQVRGPDLKSASSAELLALKHHGNHALLRLGDGWMIQTDLVRFYSADYIGSDAIPSPVGRLIERERLLDIRKMRRALQDHQVRPRGVRMDSLRHRERRAGIVRADHHQDRARDLLHQRAGALGDDRRQPRDRP